MVAGIDYEIWRCCAINTEKVLMENLCERLFFLLILIYNWILFLLCWKILSMSLELEEFFDREIFAIFGHKNSFEAANVKIDWKYLFFMHEIEFFLSASPSGDTNREIKECLALLRLKITFQTWHCSRKILICGGNWKFWILIT